MFRLLKIGKSRLTFSLTFMIFNRGNVKIRNSILTVRLSESSTKQIYAIHRDEKEEELNNQITQILDYDNNFCKYLRGDFNAKAAERKKQVQGMARNLRIKRQKSLRRKTNKTCPLSRHRYN